MPIDHLPPEMTGLPAPLFLMGAPGLDEGLAAELRVLREAHGVRLIVSLVVDWELDFLGISDLVERAHVRSRRPGAVETADQEVFVTAFRQNRATSR